MVTFFPLFMFWRQFKKFAIFIKMVRILRKMSHTKFPAYQYQKNIWQKHECPLPIQYPLYIWKITSFIYFVSQTVEDKEDTYHVPRSDSESSSRQNPEEETDLSHEAAMKSEGSDGRSRFRCTSAAFPPIPAPFPPTILTFPMSWISPGPSLFIFNKILSR